MASSLPPHTNHHHNHPSIPSSMASHPPPDSPGSSSSISSGHAGDSPVHPQPNHSSSSDHIHITPSPPPPLASNHLSISPPESTDSSSISFDHSLHALSPRHQHSNNNSFHEITLHHDHAISPPAPLTQSPPLVNRLVREDPVLVTKMESAAETGFADEDGGGGRGSVSDGGSGGGVAGGGERLRVRRSLSILRRAKREVMVKRAALGLRVFEFVACLVSLSVMASDRNRGWALDSFDRYLEFRYSLTVSVLGFAYSGFQVLDLIYQLTTSNQKPRQFLRCCFDFTMDQILAYLLASASSSAATRIDDWITNWGKDKFPATAGASTGVSFLAFFAFACSSIISGYILCSRRYT